MKRILINVCSIVAIVAIAVYISTYMASCSLYKLEHKLSKGEVRDFYNQHWMVMETRVPEFIDTKQPTERMYFLRLSPDLQKKYIETFSKMRDIFFEDEFNFRFAISARWFSDEGVPHWATDRGRIMLLCGQPDYEDEFLDGELYLQGQEEWMNPETGILTRLWRYWWNRSGSFFQSLIDFRFCYDRFNRWRYIESTDALVRDFMDYWRWRMGPTEDGWKLWEKEIKK